jgi:hypothetical protein
MDSVKQSRKRTSMESLVRIGVYCSQNVEALSGKTFRQACRQVRGEFPSVVITDKAIVKSLEAAGVACKRRRSVNNPYGDRAGRVAKVLLNVVARLEHEFGMAPETLLTECDADILAKIMRREKFTPQA